MRKITHAERAPALAPAPYVLALSIKDAARAAGDVSTRYLFLEMAAGRLASMKVGRRRMIMREDLQAWLASKRSGGAMSDVSAIAPDGNPQALT